MLSKYKIPRLSALFRGLYLHCAAVLTQEPQFKKEIDVIH